MHICQTTYPAASTIPVVGVDFLLSEKSNGGFEYVLLLIDHFTRYTQVYPTKIRRPKQQQLINFIMTLSWSSPYHSKYSAIREEFENDLFKKFVNLLGIHNLRTTPYHPWLNGLTVSMNQTVISRSRTLTEKSSWLTISAKQYKHIIVPAIVAKDTHHSIYCLVENHGWQKTLYFGGNKTPHQNITTKNTLRVGQKRWMVHLR